MSQAAIFLFGVAVFFLGGVGLVLVGLDAFRSWSDDDEEEGHDAFEAAEASRAVDRTRLAADAVTHADDRTGGGGSRSGGPSSSGPQ